MCFIMVGKLTKMGRLQFQGSLQSLSSQKLLQITNLCCSAIFRVPERGYSVSVKHI